MGRTFVVKLVCEARRRGEKPCRVTWHQRCHLLTRREDESAARKWMGAVGSARLKRTNVLAEHEYLMGCNWSDCMSGLRWDRMG